MFVSKILSCALENWYPQYFAVTIFKIAVSYTYLPHELTTPDATLNQGLIELLKAVRGHATYVDGEILHVRFFD